MQMAMARRDEPETPRKRKQRPEYYKAWREKNKDIYRSHSKAQYEADRDKILARQYGMTPEAVRALRRANGGRCAICGVPESEAPKGILQIDHDHATSVVRDLLCSRCNTGIAMFKENINVIASAREYLEQHRAQPRTAETWQVLVAAHPDPAQPPVPTISDPWLRETRSIRRSAELCGVSRRTVENWVRDNLVEYARTPSGQLRVFVDTLLVKAQE